MNIKTLDFACFLCHNSTENSLQSEYHCQISSTIFTKGLLSSLISYWHRFLSKRPKTLRFWVSAPLHRASLKSDALAQKDEGVGPHFSELWSPDDDVFNLKTAKKVGNWQRYAWWPGPTWTFYWLHEVHSRCVCTPSASDFRCQFFCFHTITCRPAKASLIAFKTNL